jgi:hypothetical protein
MTFSGTYACVNPRYRFSVVTAMLNERMYSYQIRILCIVLFEFGDNKAQ